MSKPRAPSHLTKEAQRWWRKIVDEYAIDDDAGLLLITTAMEAFDRMKEAAAAIESNGGPEVRDRFNQLKTHPMVKVELDSRAAMLKSLAALNLDLEPLRDAPGRPPGR